MGLTKQSLTKQPPAASASTRSRQGSADPRAARTRKAIVDAVHELAAEGARLPTVSEVVRRAGISRSSFYTQFAGVDQVAALVLREALVEIGAADVALRREGAPSGEATGIAIGRLVAHVAEHRSLYALGLSADLPGHSEVTVVLLDRLREAIALVPGTHRGITTEGEARYVAGGLLAVLTAWVTGDLDATPDELTHLLLVMLPSWAVSTSAAVSTAQLTTTKKPQDQSRQGEEG